MEISFIGVSPEFMPVLFGCSFRDFLKLVFLADCYDTVDKPLKTGAYLMFLIVYAEVPALDLAFLRAGVTDFLRPLLFLRFEFSLSEFDEFELYSVFKPAKFSFSSLIDMFSLGYSESLAIICFRKLIST